MNTENIAQRQPPSANCAIAFGEGLREQFKQVESEHCTLEDIKVSDTAEMMDKNSYIKVGSIKW